MIMCYICLYTQKLYPLHYPHVEMLLSPTQGLLLIEFSSLVARSINSVYESQFHLLICFIYFVLQILE
jgi:hypothetical protein